MVTDCCNRPLAGPMQNRPGQGYYESRDQTLTFPACRPRVDNLIVMVYSYGPTPQRRAAFSAKPRA